MKTQTPKQRLEYLRGELRAERISLDEIHELQNLVPHIAAGDVELLEAAGVPEFPNRTERRLPQPSRRILDNLAAGETVILHHPAGRQRLQNIVTERARRTGKRYSQQSAMLIVEKTVFDVTLVTCTENANMAATGSTLTSADTSP